VLSVPQWDYEKLCQSLDTPVAPFPETPEGCRAATSSAGALLPIGVSGFLIVTGVVLTAVGYLILTALL